MIAQLPDGFEVEINEKHLNDWKVLKMLRGIDKGDQGMIVDVAELLLSEEQLEALEKHLEVDGITRITAMVTALQELMNSVKEIKN